MARPLLTDDLRAVIEPLLPNWTPSPKLGHPRLDDRKMLTGIFFVLKTVIPWEATVHGPSVRIVVVKGPG